MRVLVLPIVLAIVAAGCITPTLESGADLAESATESLVDDAGLAFLGGILDFDVMNTGEPSIAIGIDGTVYVCAPAGAQKNADARDLNFIWRSDDEGASFTPLPTKGRENAPGGGDCDIALDSRGTLFEIGLHSVILPMAITFAASDDRGESWRDAKMVSNLPVNDRQWLITHENAIYVSWQQIDTGIWVAKSTDGGFTFPQQTLALPRYANDKLQRYFIEGPTRVSAVDGTVYVPDGSQNGLDFWGLPNPTGMHERYGNVAVSEDGGLTWTIKRTTANTGWSFNIDRAGNLYSTGRVCDTDEETKNVTGCRPVYWFSTDKATTWQGPFEVTAEPGLLIKHMWVTAGSTGRVGIGYYASNETNWARENATGDWHLYFAGTMNALEGNDSTWFSKRVIDEPVHQGPLGRDLVDFLSVVINPVTGRPHVAYTSTFNLTKEQRPYGRIGHALATEGPLFYTEADLATPIPVKN